MELALVICVLAIAKASEFITTKVVDYKKFVIANDKYKEWLDER